MWRMFVIGLGILLVFSLGVGGAQAQDLRVRCQWWPPQSGATADHYRLHIEDINNGDSFDYTVDHQGGEAHVLQEYIFLDGQYGREYRARVQAVDAANRSGPWSSWSVVYAFEVPEP